jgi:hypothetical protein
MRRHGEEVDVAPALFTDADPSNPGHRADAGLGEQPQGPAREVVHLFLGRCPQRHPRPLDVKCTSSVILSDMDRPAQPLACSLEGNDLTQRLEAWRQVAARATTRRVEQSRVVAVYPNDPQLRDELHELIALEGECCSFLRFDVEERPDAIVTELHLPDDLGRQTRTRILDAFG